jgi:hypothetical protein
MGLWSALKAAGTGNFSDATNYLFLDEDVITTKIAVDNAQELMVKERAATGAISEEQASGYLNDIQRNAYPYLFDELGGPSQAFVDELGTQVKNLPRNFSDTVNKTLGEATSLTVRAIPWYLWLIIIIAAFVYFSPFLMPFIRRK